MITQPTFSSDLTHLLDYQPGFASWRANIRRAAVRRIHFAQRKDSRPLAAPAVALAALWYHLRWNKLPRIRA